MTNHNVQDTPAQPEIVRWLTPDMFLATHAGLLSRSFLYKAIRDGRIPAKRIGGKLLMKSNAFDQLLDARRTAA
jgi:excisionase family DNA binding protein